MGRAKDEFKYNASFLAHVPWVDDGVILGERQPGLVKERLSSLGHSGTWWHNYLSYPCTGSAGEMTELGW